jgi:hypothetical protein
MPTTLTLLQGIVVLIAATAVVAGPMRARADGTGAIEAEVKYVGPAVTPKTLKVNRDTAQCGQEIVSEELVVGETRGVANVVVSVPSARIAGARKAVIDARGCRFVPRVVTMTPGELEVRNADEILHSVHTFSTVNPPVNRPHPKSKRVLIEKFENPEIIKLTCDVHPWMLAWVAVMPTAAAGVTDQAGAVTIDRLPAGTHTVEIWHELLGKQAKDVEIRPGRTTRVGFELKGKER